MTAALAIVAGDRAKSAVPARPHEMKLEVFDSIPSGHIAYAVTDDSCMPLARRGEVLVVTDQPRLCVDMFPGQWLLIQWISPPTNEYQRSRVGQTIGIASERGGGVWGYRPPCNAYRGVIYCGDFGFSYMQMCDYIRGRVVGIYRPGARA